MSVKGILQTSFFQKALVVWSVFFLFSGQGFRNLLGVSGYALLCILSVFLHFYSFQSFPKFWKKSVTLLLFILLAFVSVLWSATPGITIIGSCVLFTTSLISAFHVFSFSRETLFCLIYRGLQISLVVGILFELYVSFVVKAPLLAPYDLFMKLIHFDLNETPVYWSDDLLLEGGPIQGFVANRNIFGNIALLTGILAFILMLNRSISPIDSLFTLALSVVVHQLTLSATVSISIVLIILLGFVGASFRFLPKKNKKLVRRTLSWGFILFMITFLIFIFVKRTFFFGLFNRAPDFTDRTLIWSKVSELASQRFFGWGWVNYWPVWEYPYKGLISLAGIPIAHAHNAYIDTWLQLGIPGALLLIFMSISILLGCWRLIERAEKKDSLLPILWCLLGTALTLQGLTESRLILEGNWYLFVVLLLYSPNPFSSDLQLKGDRLEIEHERKSDIDFKKENS
jgi:exopolysaccharide production protein ExoQ